MFFLKYYTLLKHKAILCQPHTYIESQPYTYIIGQYNPSVRITDLVSHTTYIVCVNFIHKLRDLQFKVDPERQILLETFHDSFNLLSEFLPAICWEELAEEILFVFWFDVWLGARTLAFRLISQHTYYYLLDHGDFD